MKYQPNWPSVKEHLIQWWNRKGLVVSIGAVANKPHENLPEPPKPATGEQAHVDAALRTVRNIYAMSRRFYGGDTFPVYDGMIGPGSLSTFLGAQPHFSPETVWYDPCISDPDRSGPIRFDLRNNKWWDIHMDLLREGVKHSHGRFAVGIPDLIENLDTLASLRGSQELVMDLVERPAWVKERNFEINEAFFAAFDRMYEVVKIDGGNVFTAFGLWGPGRTAKVQCDFSCMISPAMFKEFVAPALAAQCDWLDYSMYHLDGEDAMQHLDALLAIDSLDAIEWTPVGTCGVAGRPAGGSPVWYDLYRRIKKAGKSVQAIAIKPDEVRPLLDAVGPEGMYLSCWVNDQATAEKVLADVEQYR